MAIAPFASVNTGKSSERNRLAGVGVVGLVVIGALAVWAAKWSTPPNVGFADSTTATGGIDGGAASVLAMVSIVAIGIERLIEIFWSMIGSFKNGWWPLPEIADAVDRLTEEANQIAKPAFQAALDGLAAAQATLQEGDAQRALLDAEIARINVEVQAYRDQIASVGSLAKNNQRVQLVATTAFQAAQRLDTAYGSVMPAVRQAFNDVSQMTAGVSDILAGFKDNPAKKVISIFLGSAAGLLVAGTVGLDLFAAAGLPLGETDPAKIPLSAFPYVGVMLTGLVVGLGANPTHEVVRWASEAAKSRKTASLGLPNVSGGPDDREGGAAGVPFTAEQAAASILDLLAPIGIKTTPRARPGTMNLH